VLQFVYKRTPVRLSAVSLAFCIKPGTACTHTHTHTYTPSLRLIRSLKAVEEMVVVSEWELMCCSSEMDGQVETDRPWNTKGNIGSSHIMRPVNLNASRLRSEEAMADD